MRRALASALYRRSFGMSEYVSIYAFYTREDLDVIGRMNPCHINSLKEFVFNDF